MLESAEHLDAALLIVGSIDSGSAATTWFCFGLSVEVVAGGVSWRQSSVLESAEHLDKARLTNGSVDSGSATTLCVGLSVEAAVVEVDGSRAC